MPLIFVDLDSADYNDKLFNALKAGDSAAKAEAKMQKVVKTIIDKAPGFTTNKTEDAKGYAIRLTVSKVEFANHRVNCSLSGDIVSYPPLVNKKGEKGEEMVSTGMAGNGFVDGTSQDAVVDCIEAIAESLVTKSVPMMRTDNSKR
jgi:hypothetical protein